MRATMLALNQITIMSLFQIECTYLNALDEQEVTARVFMPLSECPSKRCTVNKAKGNLILQLRASKFLKFQEVCLLHYILITISNLQHNCFTFLILVQAKIQELAEHVPKGHIPRSMTVHFRGELTRKVGNIFCLFMFYLSVFERSLSSLN